MITWIDDTCNENRNMILALDNLKSDKLSKLSKILKEEFPQSTITTLVDKRIHMHDVVIFEDLEDVVAFRLKYGHEYGEKNV